MLGLNDVAFLGSLTTAGGYDPDAQAYISAVETADGQALEVGVKDAINAFVVGCKTDGIWSAIKACCILAGARTLAGALVPLVGTAPTNFNFAPGDYSRQMGLKGNASTKYLNSNRNNNADPQDNKHLAIYKSVASIGNNTKYIGAQATTPIASESRIADNVGALTFSANSSSSVPAPYTFSQIGFLGASRASSLSFSYRANGVTTASAIASNANIDLNIFVFGRNLEGSLNQPTDARLVFYSIGESLDLALLDARATALINAFAAIPFDFLNPANIGQPVGGGFFGGLISHTADGNPTHALIVAPAATGATGTGYTLTTNLAWKTSDTATTGADSLFDGQANLAAMVAAGIADHPAAQFCYNLSIGGFNDWYLPSQLEKDIVYSNLKPNATSNATGTGVNAYAVPPRTANYTAGNPAQTAVAAFQTGGAEAFAAAAHWASNQVTAANGRRLSYNNGAITSVSKSTLNPVRAFRRIAL
jgi:hypothetical protein